MFVLFLNLLWRIRHFSLFSLEKLLKPIPPNVFVRLSIQKLVFHNIKILILSISLWIRLNHNVFIAWFHNRSHHNKRSFLFFNLLCGVSSLSGIRKEKAHWRLPFETWPLLIFNDRYWDIALVCYPVHVLLDMIVWVELQVLSLKEIILQKFMDVERIWV